MKLKSVLAGLMAAVTAVSASVCGMSVSAGAVTRKITYIGRDNIYIYDNIVNDKEWGDLSNVISSDAYKNESVIECPVADSKDPFEIPIVEKIKSTDVVTFSVIKDSGEEIVLDATLELSLDVDLNFIITSYGEGDRTYGVFRSGISVQEMIDQYNKDLSNMRREFNNVKDITFNDVIGIYAYVDAQDREEFYNNNYTWKITVEPGDGKSPSKPDKNDTSDNDQQDKIIPSKKVTYTGHADSIKKLPGFHIYDNLTGDKFISSAGMGTTDINADWAGGDVSFTENIKPYDTVTFSITLPSGEEKKLNVTFRLQNYDSPILNDVVPSGITVQEMVEIYNKELAKERKNEWLKNAKDITYKNIWSIYVNGDDQQDYDNFEWKVTIEPGDPNDIKSSKAISEAKVTAIKDQSYTGKAIKPTITVKDGDKKLVKGTDYTVSYKNNTNIGTATVTITGKGDYTGTKTLTFKIVPKKVKLTGKSSGTKETLSWKKSAGAAGYEIYRSIDGGKFTRLTTTKALKYTAKLTAGKSYKFKVLPYAIVNGKKVYGSWSNVVSVK